MGPNAFEAVDAFEKPASPAADLSMHLLRGMVVHNYLTRADRKR